MVLLRALPKVLVLVLGRNFGIGQLWQERSFFVGSYSLTCLHFDEAYSVSESVLHAPLQIGAVPDQWQMSERISSIVEELERVSRRT